MAGSRNIPLLEQYLALPPEASLIVLSGIIGASTNWLVLRYISGLLRPGSGQTRTGASAPASADDESADSAGDETAVLLVSFLRDFAFWRDAAGRLGMDLASLAKKGRFGFVDGLTGLFSGSAAPSSQGPAQLRTARRLVWGVPLPGLQGIAKTLHEAVDDLLLAEATTADAQPRRRRVVLVVDQPDFLLSAAGPGATVTEMQNLLLDLREKVHACMVIVSADEPLVSAQTTTLEREHASLLLSLAHEARMVLSLRLLDTGTANDVSGVLRITRGGAPESYDADDGSDVEEHEYLYHVGGDGAVRVFERGGH